MIENILEKIVEKRRENHLSQKYMADKLNITQSYYSKIENGKKDPNLKTILEITTILNIHPAELFPDPAASPVTSSVLSFAQNLSRSEN